MRTIDRSAFRRVSLLVRRHGGGFVVRVTGTDEADCLNDTMRTKPRVSGREVTRRARGRPVAIRGAVGGGEAAGIPAQHGVRRGEIADGKLTSTLYVGDRAVITATASVTDNAQLAGQVPLTSGAAHPRAACGQ